MAWQSILAFSLCMVGGGFFLAGTVGVLRFPDSYSRLHALTKGDNLGLGFVCLGVAIEMGSFLLFIKLLLIWLLSLAASAGACYLISSMIYKTDQRFRSSSNQME